ncbi:DUF2171 domain-containing protein [Muricoccus radiodurans]|uniref:DUF2171 domain-containing protein n=1 Tax=Muricoccus radiodurans TaxID=2231721 RepID=UPI003CFB69A7
MADASQIKEHMEVVGSCGHHVGTVDHVEGNRIKLTKNDGGDGQHHYLPISLVASVEDGKVKTSMNHLDTIKQFQNA